MLTSLAYDLRTLITLALMVAAVLGGVVGLVQVLRMRADAFTAAGKLSKNAWAGILAAASLVAFAFGPLHLLGLVAVVAIIVYWVDVRPALQRVLGNSRGGGGPYGGW